MARRIETPHGTLLGRVDRVAREVVWALVCPGCGDELPLLRSQFNGEAATVCECGWKIPREGNDPPSWYDFRVTFETTAPRETANVAG